MCNFGIWISCFTALTACGLILSLKAQSTRNGVIMLKFPFNAQKESVSDYYRGFSGGNVKGKRITQSSNTQNIHAEKSTSKIGGPISNYVTTLSSDSLNTLRQDDRKARRNEKRLIYEPLYFSERRHATSTGVFDFLTLGDKDNIIEKNDECHSNYDCRILLKYSICQLRKSGNICICLPGYVLELRECYREVYIGDYCKLSIQCPARSNCRENTCVCRTGFANRGNECVDERNVTDPPNFLVALIAGVVFLIVVSCLFVIIMALKRKLRQARSNAIPDDTPSISAVVDTRRPVSPDPAYQRIDKPPTYDEAMSSTTTLLTLSIEDITSEPPSYVEAQQERRNRQLHVVS